MKHHLQTRDRLLEIIGRFQSCNIAVAGDLIADHFLYGRIARVSREAPVLVLEYGDLVRLPGGAANAANNLLALGCRVVVIGAIGQDAAGADLVTTLASRGADVRHVARLESYSTPVKTRIFAGAHHSLPQQIVRIDRVSKVDIHRRSPWGNLRRALRQTSAIIISDYGYGAVIPRVFKEWRSIAKRAGIPIVVDSRFRMGDFKDITSITPNITELEAAMGISIGANQELLYRVARQILRKQNLRSLLVTQGRFGMTLLEPRRPPVHIPIYGTDDVADVTGAGDTVISVFTLTLACGGSPEDGARLANYAGGIVVMKRGTATVSREELTAAVKKDLTR